MTTVRANEFMSEAVFSPAYRRYVLVALSVVYGMNWVDRCLINLLLQPIKNDLSLTDTQLGLLTGIAFAAFYATLGIPIARWSDRGDRVTVASVSIGLWGIAVMLCLGVSNYLQLVFARVIAAVGESGAMPPTYSLLGDYFPRPIERVRAMSIYWLASPVATLASFAGGGWISTHFGWRYAFFIMGIPALFVAILVRTTVKEPRAAAGKLRSQLQSPTLRDTLAFLWRQRSSRRLMMATVLFFAVSQGLAPWYAAFLIRSHQMTVQELGSILGLIFGVGGIVGVLSGGAACARLGTRSEAAQLRICAVVFALTLPCFLVFLFSSSRAMVVAALVPLAVLFNFVLAPVFTLMQRLVPDNMRATTLAAVMLVANLVGMGLGPLAVGALSDWLRPSQGNESLRLAMGTLSFVTLLTSAVFWWVSRSVSADLVALAANVSPSIGSAQRPMQVG